MPMFTETGVTAECNSNALDLLARAAAVLTATLIVMDAKLITPSHCEASCSCAGALAPIVSFRIR